MNRKLMLHDALNDHLRECRCATNGSARSSGLRKIIQLLNLGKIREIYTMAMAKEFEADLRSLRKIFLIHLRFEF